MPRTLPRKRWKGIPGSAIEQRWWSKDTIAIVTGSNKGIGREIVKQLAKEGLLVVLTARDEARGKQAMESLSAEGLCVAFHELDITDQESINELVGWLKMEYGGIDILVNNAGVNFNVGDDNSIDHAERVIQTNYYGTKQMTEAMVPLLRSSPFGPRIVNVASRLGRLNKLQNDIRHQLENPENLTKDLIDSFLEKFLGEVKAGTWMQGGWPRKYTDYSVSKIALNAYTRLLALRHSYQQSDHKIYVNSYCPGFAKTDMTGGEGVFTVKEAADTAIWLALLPPDLPSGLFFAGRRMISF